ncbi:MAG: hypothetical protein H6Q55_3429 [Deltaproteobacteria bacterium]|nr:hypothetical protein [Deltaproteobacteria bacterium]
MRRTAIVLVMLVLLGAGAHTVCAHTYTYHNNTNHLVRIDVQLYDDANSVAEIAGHKSHTISTRSLIKSWTVAVFLDNEWQQALELTCDLLPGDHTFSIYVREIGEGKRDWYVIKQ